MSTCTAKLVGYIFTPKGCDAAPIFDVSPAFEPHLSPDRWERRPVYVLSPDPVLTVDVEVAA